MSSDRPEPEPQTALARWDSAEIGQGRLVQPLTEDESRPCLHPTADHGYLGCNTCGCPRSEDDHLGALCRWPAHEQAGSREPWVWRPGMHMDRFPHGMAFTPKNGEPSAIKPWMGSVADLPENSGAYRGLMQALDPEGAVTGEPMELLGPFYMRRAEGRLAEFVAWGGLLHDPHAEPVLTAQSIRITPLDAEGKPTGPPRTIQAVADVIVTLRPVLEDVAVTVGHMAHAAMEFSAQLKRFAYSRILNAFYVADRVLTWTRDGRRVWVHRSWVRPGPAMGLTRRQKRAQRRIHRRSTR